MNAIPSNINIGCKNIHKFLKLYFYFLDAGLCVEFLHVSDYEKIIKFVLIY